MEDTPRRARKPTPFEPLPGTLRLVVLAGERLGRRVTLEASRLLIGRGDDCDICFANERVSWHHAEIRQIGPQAHVLVDLESRNGTFLNGERVVGERLLTLGDKLRFGSDLVVQVSLFDPVEEQLRQRQRLETLGRASAGFAHDFNNLLGAMIANLGYLQRLELPVESPEVAECLVDLNDAATRAAELSERLMDFARGERTHPTPCDVGEIAEEVARLVRRTFDRSVEVQTICEEGLLVHGDGLELHQVLMNLCINARDAMPQGGHLTLRARRDSEAGTVEISVIDTGGGMSSRTLRQIFQPFFTTKGIGGFGLGLATVREIVTALGGTIAVQSELGKGSTFDISLPALEQPRRPPGTRSAIRKRQGKRARPLRVLVVDDEAAVQRSLRRILTQAGHQVSLAASGADALARYADAEPDVVLLDVDMPAMTGDEALRRLRDHHEEAVVVMMSGHRDQAREGRLRDAGAVTVLHKPLSASALLVALEEATQGPDDAVPPDRPTLI